MFFEQQYRGPLATKCQKCQVENHISSKFCKELGTQLHPADNAHVLITRTKETPVEELAKRTQFERKFESTVKLDKGGRVIENRVENVRTYRMQICFFSFLMKVFLILENQKGEFKLFMQKREARFKRNSNLFGMTFQSYRENYRKLYCFKHTFICANLFLILLINDLDNFNTRKLNCLFVSVL